MAEYIRLISINKVSIDPLISNIYNVSDIESAYSSISDGSNPLLIIISYPDRAVVSDDFAASKLSISVMKKPIDGHLNFGFIGSGSFVSSSHLPYISSLSDTCHVRAIATKTSSSANTASNRFSPDYVTTDYRHLLDDASIDAVIVSTRHDSHASIALQALHAGKHVLLEKPLCLTRDDLDEFKSFFKASSSSSLPSFLVGYNRRFSLCF